MPYQVLVRVNPQRPFEFAGFAVKQHDESFESFIRRVAEAQRKPLGWVKVKPTEVH